MNLFIICSVFYIILYIEISEISKEATQGLIASLKTELKTEMESLKTEFEEKLAIVETSLKEAQDEIKELKGTKTHATASDVMDDMDTRNRMKYVTLSKQNSYLHITKLFTYLQGDLYTKMQLLFSCQREVGS